MPDPGTILGIALVGGLTAWIARLYLRDARAYRAGQGDERYAWLRRSHPSHPALPPAPRKPLLRALPQQWGWRHAFIVAVQILAIGGLIYGMASDMGPEHVIGFLVINTIFVAFATAVLTRLWDLASAVLARRRTGTRQRQ